MLKKNDRPAFRFYGQDRTIEENTRRSSSNSSFDSITHPQFPTFKPKEGENCIRLLPPSWEDKKRWGAYWDIAIWSHYRVGGRGTYLCLAHMKNEACPVCEAARNAADREEARQFTAGKRALCWIIDRNNEKAGPLLWSMPNESIYQEINARSQNRKTKELIMLDRQSDDDFSGYDITFTRKGTDWDNTKYSAVEIDRELTPLHDDEAIETKWLLYIQAHPLPEVLKFYDYDHIEKVLTGRAEPKREESEEETEEAPPSRRRPPRTEEAGCDRFTRRRNPEPEDETEDEPDGFPDEPMPSKRAARGDIEEEHEETEPTASPRRFRGRPVAEEEEEEPEDDDVGTEKVSAQARSRLNRLKERHAR